MKDLRMTLVHLTKNGMYGVVLELCNEFLTWKHGVDGHEMVLRGAMVGSMMIPWKRVFNFDMYILLYSSICKIPPCGSASSLNNDCFIWFEILLHGRLWSKQTNSLHNAQDGQLFYFKQRRNMITARSCQALVDVWHGRNHPGFWLISRYRDVLFLYAPSSPHRSQSALASGPNFKRNKTSISQHESSSL